MPPKCEILCARIEWNRKQEHSMRRKSLDHRVVFVIIHECPNQASLQFTSLRHHRVLACWLYLNIRHKFESTSPVTCVIGLNVIRPICLRNTCASSCDPINVSTGIRGCTVNTSPGWCDDGIGLPHDPIHVSTMDLALGKYKIKSESTSIPQRMKKAVDFFLAEHKVVRKYNTGSWRSIFCNPLLRPLTKS